MKVYRTGFAHTLMISERLTCHFVQRQRSASAAQTSHVLTHATPAGEGRSPSSGAKSLAEFARCFAGDSFEDDVQVFGVSEAADSRDRFGGEFR